MVAPTAICSRHLIAEHGEIHAMLGNLKHTGTWAGALTRRGYLEPQNAVYRHNQPAAEMSKRGFNHKSPLDARGMSLPAGRVDMKRSIRDLAGRCGPCRESINAFGGECRSND